MSLIFFSPGGLLPTLSIMHVLSFSTPARLQVPHSKDHALNFLPVLHYSEHMVIIRQSLMVATAMQVPLCG